VRTHNGRDKTGTPHPLPLHLALVLHLKRPHMRLRDVPNMHKQRQPVPRHLTSLVTVDEGVDRGRRGVDVLLARDILQRRAIDHWRVEGRDDEVVRGSVVESGVFGEGLGEVR
jgi:acyl CoA:acetate/3-ketoacid CoA transferase